QRPFLRPFAKGERTACARFFLKNDRVSFGKNRRWRGAIFHAPGPETLRDGRRSMVGWFEALDDCGENVALTRSRHLIDGSLSLDGFRSGWTVAMAALGPTSRPSMLTFTATSPSLRQLVE